MSLEFRRSSAGGRNLGVSDILMVFKTSKGNEITMRVNAMEKVITDCITASLQDSRN